MGGTNRLLSFDTTWTARKTTPPTIPPCRRNVFTEPLPSNVIGTLLCLFVATVDVFTEPLFSNKHIDTQTDGRHL
jgi:hypothetical protein